MSLPKRALGKTGELVTIAGLGGEGVLRTYGYDREAYSLINRAIDLGLNYFESARAYSGSELYYGQALKDRRKDIFLTSKSHARDRQGALDHLQQTLSNMCVDYLDLWQVHDVRTEDDIDQIMAKGGAIEAFDLARRKGFVRFVGVTGHHDPFILKKIVDQFDFDTVLMPVNPAEVHYKSFIDIVGPSALKKNMGIIAMKIYFRGFAKKIPGFTEMKPFFRYAISQPVSVAVIGCDSVEQLEENVGLASGFVPMTVDEQSRFESYVQPFARELMYYKP